MSDARPVRDIGRYRVYDEIAAGGMATVSFGRLLGPVGFARTVAIKQLHAQFAKDPEFVSMFLDEARLAARIHHPNVVATLDVVASKNELVLVMDYVHGEALGRLMRAAAAPVSPKIAAGIICGALQGLHAAHEARSEGGHPLGIVHRDISPQNILVGVDGIPRVLDFGVAKAANRLQTTQEGHLKGKIRYMSPEQIQGLDVTRRTDVYAMSVVLFELVTARALFPRGEPAAVVHEILQGKIPRPSSINPQVPPALDEIILRGLERNPVARFADAQMMAMQLEERIGLATASQIGGWVQGLVRDDLALRAATVSAIESSSAHALQRPKTPPTEIRPQGVVQPVGPPSAPTIRTSPSYVDVASDPSFQLPPERTGKTANTAFTVGAPTTSSPLTAIVLGLCGLFALAGVGLILLFVLKRPTVAAAAAAPPPPAMTTSAIPVAETPAPPEPESEPEPEAVASAAPSAIVAMPKKPAFVPAPASPPKPAAAPADPGMARSRR